MNKVILIGRLGQEPELKELGGETQVCKFSIATTWYNSKTKENEAVWHKIVVWNKLAGICKKCLNKGRLVSVEGRLSYNKWENKDGVKMTTAEVVAENVTFLDNKNTNFKDMEKTDRSSAKSNSKTKDNYYESFDKEQEPDLDKIDEDDDVLF